MKNEIKTPDPSKPGGDQNPQDMGGPSFKPAATPDGAQEQKIGKSATENNGGNYDKAALADTAILDDEQIPAVAPPDDRQR